MDCKTTTSRDTALPFTTSATAPRQRSVRWRQSQSCLQTTSRGYHYQCALKPQKRKQWMCGFSNGTTLHRSIPMDLATGVLLKRLTNFSKALSSVFISSSSPSLSVHPLANNGLCKVYQHRRCRSRHSGTGFYHQHSVSRCVKVAFTIFNDIM